MRLAGTIVLYNPDEDVFGNIQSYIEELDILYVMDNSDNKNKELVNKVKEIKKCKYKDMKGNKGVACALNRALRCAAQSGYEWILTMDQDSRLSSDGLFKMKTYIMNNIDKETAIVCPRYKYFYDKRNTCPREISYVMHAITSGSIVNIPIAKKVGGFLNKLFIDEVDYEFCYRTILHGYRIVKLNNIVFEHSLGAPKVKDGIITYNYSPIRYYYIIRNECYVIKKYKQYPQLFQICEEKKGTIINWIVRVFHEKDRIKKYCYMFLGFIHCQLGIMGKLGNCYKKREKRK